MVLILGFDQDDMQVVIASEGEALSGYALGDEIEELDSILPGIDLTSSGALTFIGDITLGLNGATFSNFHWDAALGLKVLAHADQLLEALPPGANIIDFPFMGIPGPDGSVGINVTVKRSGDALLHYHPPVGIRLAQESGVNEGDAVTEFAKEPSVPTFVSENGDLLYVSRMRADGRIFTRLRRSVAADLGDISDGALELRISRQGAASRLTLFGTQAPGLYQLQRYKEGENTFGPLGQPIEADGDSIVFPDVPDGGRARQIFRARLLN